MAPKKRYQASAKNPQAAFWAQARDYYRKFRERSRLEGVRVWAREREVYCSEKLSEAHAEVAA